MKTPPPMGGCTGWFCGRVVQWVNGWGQVILLSYIEINLDLIKIKSNSVCKIYDLLRHPHLWVGVWVLWVGSGQMTNLIKLELINRI